MYRIGHSKGYSGIGYLLALGTEQPKGSVLEISIAALALEDQNIAN